ncbi:tyrosine-type recombinase/integrase [Bradyrhizobium cosmicum]|uniref:Tyr recombinase domain-containing protein n=1 Tax=Bradyrhizobium cosmicum TaxID=1404864 RepID=A0AAI8Q9Y8_9BRAD|nr:site-specific integrase [Bradyrhizobium cosmicum]BAL73750.1 hypothetical protein S23_05290 [Bradyrhizobium cosmicum]
MRTKKLKPADLKAFKDKGRYSDGGGLYYVIGSKGERRWAFLYKSRRERYPTGAPKVHELGLGGAPAPDGDKPAVSLADARRRADTLRRLLSEGKDPLTEKRSEPIPSPVVVHVELPERPADEKNVLFGTFADAYFKAKKGEWKNEKHVNQWKRSIEVEAAPLRDKIIRDIDTDEVLSLLRPIFLSTPETGKRLQERLSKIFAAATVEKYRDGANPAAWAGHLKETDLRTRKASDVKSHEALPFNDIPLFMHTLRRYTSMSARALEWTILSVARTSETIGARWSEIDYEQKLWIVPAGRMKKSREHRVPLTDSMLTMLEEQRKITGGFEFIFSNNGDPLSNMAMTEVVKGLVRPPRETDQSAVAAVTSDRWQDAIHYFFDNKGAMVCSTKLSRAPTVHGFRSSFSDWANDTTEHDAKIIDFCLAHINSDKTEAAYRRSDAVEKRRRVLIDWDGYCRSRG